MTAVEMANENVIEIIREFDAPRDLLWDVWTESKHIEKWFGPKGFDTRVDEMDLRVGGKSRYVMIGPDGKEYPGKGTFLEVSPKDRIVSTDEFGDDFEKAAGGADLPQGMILTTLFDVVSEKKSKLTIRVAHPTPEDKKKHEAMGVVDGWKSSLEKMDEYLAELQG
jgi:uncharacterized protein YndB with AHSA1/START domain